eukprot:gene8526-350_t
MEDIEYEKLKKELKKSNQEFQLYKTPWFPRHIKDLDQFKDEILSAGEVLESDHPGFHDKDYRARRDKISDIANNFKYGQKIPKIEYTQTEVNAWGLIYEKLTSLFPKYACKQMNEVFPLLEKNCGYKPTNIPQLEDISQYLQSKTGFSIRPVSGLLSPRNFLNGLAFKVFHSTQYIRHHSKPFYTPEPDIIHELLGHVPLFSDQDFADFSEYIGLASIGASDETIMELANCYWFTVEFGLCLEDGKRKAYGAGLLSSANELKYSMSNEPKISPFVPEIAAKTDHPISAYNPEYFVAESFEDAKFKMRDFSRKLEKQFRVNHNTKEKMLEIVSLK